MQEGVGGDCRLRVQIIWFDAGGTGCVWLNVLLRAAETLPFSLHHPRLCRGDRCSVSTSSSPNLRLCTSIIWLVVFMLAPPPVQHLLSCTCPAGATPDIDPLLVTHRGLYGRVPIQGLHPSKDAPTSVLLVWKSRHSWLSVMIQHVVT